MNLPHQSRDPQEAAAHSCGIVDEPIHLIEQPLPGGRGSVLLQRLSHVGDEVIRVLDADRDADGLLGNARFAAGCFGH